MIPHGRCVLIAQRGYEICPGSADTRRSQDSNPGTSPLFRSPKMFPLSGLRVASKSSSRSCVSPGPPPGFVSRVARERGHAPVFTHHLRLLSGSKGRAEPCGGHTPSPTTSVHLHPHARTHPCLPLCPIKLGTRSPLGLFQSVDTSQGALGHV